ncbi:MAG: hypothetical protein ABI824_02055 [Acidobacteriota bacterium]
MTPVITLLGDFSSEYVDLRTIASGFDWSTALVADFAELSTLTARCEIAVVMVHVRSLGTSWVNALSRVRYIAPNARVVICHGADQAFGRRDMLERGAYGVLQLPLDAGEVRQLLGFVWAAPQRMTREPAQSSDDQRQSSQKPNAFVG